MTARPTHGKITLGATVYLDGVAWQVWSQAPGRGMWWLARYDDAGKHHTTQARSSDITLEHAHKLAQAKAGTR